MTLERVFVGPKELNFVGANPFIEANRSFGPIKPGKKLSDGSTDFGNGQIGPSLADQDNFNNPLILKEKDRHIKSKLAKSAMLGAFTTGIIKAAEISAFADGVTSGHAKDIVEVSPHAAWIGALIVSQLASFVDNTQNLRLLKHPKIGFSTNFGATSIFYSAEKIIPNHKTTRDILTLLAPKVVSKDPFLIAGALANEKILVGYVSSKAAATLISLIQIGTKEAALRFMNRKEKVETENSTEKLPRTGIVFKAFNKLRLARA